MDDWDQFHPAELQTVDSTPFEQLGAGDSRAAIHARENEISGLVDCEVGDATFIA